MQQNDDKNNSIKIKAETYFKNKWKAHVRLKPQGALDCLFLSELIDYTYYEIVKLDIKGNPFKNDRLFFADIYNIIPYQTIEETKVDKK